MNIRSIQSRAPTRIDLAGGTLDIWPLYLLLKNPVTVNLGIDLFAEAHIELTPSKNGKVTLVSADQNTQMSFDWSSAIAQSHVVPSLELHYKLFRHFFQKKLSGPGGSQLDNLNYDLKLTTKAKSPAGAGLGGSSTLSIAMIGALATWAENLDSDSNYIVRPELDGETFIDIVKDVETTVIKVPAGLQDYYGAMFGGLQAIHWGIGRHVRKEMAWEIIPELEDRLLLFYSGQSRNSGINNWELYKNFIDRKESVQDRFQQIAAATQKLTQSLEAKDWKGVGAAIAEEWKTRKTLAAGITTPEIDQAFMKAQAIAPISGKVCGAGGGGCFFVYLPTSSEKDRAQLKSQIIQIFSEQGIRSLPFRGVNHGLEVQVNRV